MSVYLRRQVNDLHVVLSEQAQLSAGCHEGDILNVNGSAFILAKQTELSNWKRDDVFEELKDEGQKSL